MKRQACSLSARVNRMQNRASKGIYRLKHDNRKVKVWGQAMESGSPHKQDPVDAHRSQPSGWAEAPEKMDPRK